MNKIRLIRNVSLLLTTILFFVAIYYTLSYAIVLIKPYAKFPNANGRIEKTGEFKAKNKDKPYPVFHIKLWNNDTIYAVKDESFLREKLVDNDSIEIYHKPYNSEKTVVDVVQIIKQNQKIFKRYAIKSTDLFLFAWYLIISLFFANLWFFVKNRLENLLTIKK